MSFSRASGCRGCCANTRSSENSPVVSVTLLPLDDQRAGRQIERVRAERHHAFLVRRTRHCPLAVAAQHRVDARDELARVEGLGQVVVGAHLEPDDAVDVLALCGEHDDRHRLAGAAQAPAHRQAVLAGQHEVEHHEMRRIALQLAVEIARIGERGHLEPLLAEIAGEEVAQAHVVVDDEDLVDSRLDGHDAIRTVGAFAEGMQL